MKGLLNVVSSPGNDTMVDQAGRGLYLTTGTTSRRKYTKEKKQSYTEVLSLKKHWL